MTQKPVPTSIDISLPFLDPLAPQIQGRQLPWRSTSSCPYGFCTIPICAHIIADSYGSNPCSTQSLIERDVSHANDIWSQACIRFELRGIDVIPDGRYRYIDDYLEWVSLCQNLPHEEDCVNVWYICGMYDPYCALTSPPSCCVAVVNDYSYHVLPHELGHILGLEGHTAYCTLMYEYNCGFPQCEMLSVDEADMALSKCLSGGCWS